MIELLESPGGIEVRWNGETVLVHTVRRPCAALGPARLRYSLFKGRFRIRDHSSLAPLRRCLAKRNGEGVDLEFPDGPLTLRFREEDGLLRVVPVGSDAEAALRIDLAAGKDERIYGCGEHFSRFDLRGVRVRVWVEEHIGTVDAVLKVLALAVGLKPRRKNFRRYATYHPQPSFVTSARRFVHAEASCHAVLDFRRPGRLRLLFHGKIEELAMGRGESWDEVTEKLTGLLGRMPELPDWIFDGMILGIQDGAEVCEAKVRRLRDAGAEVCGIWAQDWEGQRRTYFGKQLRWDYRRDEGLYPDLPDRIRSWRERGIAFLGYVNPYLCADGEQFAEAESRGFLARRSDGSTYLTTATSFPFGIVDLTNPAAYAWFKDIIATELLGIGMAGWMADFGEYLPADAVLHAGSGAEFHNLWPVLWARLNREALEEAGALGRACFFTRSGYARSSRHTTLAWNGDQHVDWSDDYGIGSVVRASLALGLSGMPICHADAGGYTTLPRMSRSKELFLRWLELCAFTPVLRSHEGNRPEANHQFDSDEETVRATARFSRIHAALKPYLAETAAQASRRGSPMMRPLFYHYGGSFGYDEDHAFLLGRDLAVYPVLEEGAAERRLVLGDDRWIGLFDGRPYGGGTWKVPAPLGTIPVFYRADSPSAELFSRIREL